MHIHKLKIKNFKSFYSETIIDFDDLTGLWRISGQIGSGKTTIGEAIIFGLYGKVADKNNNSLISWGQKKSVVELWCRSRGRNIYIRREINSYGQSPMNVEVDGEPIIFTDKRSAQEQLESEYLDAPRTTMELLCIISFNNFKSLSTLNTKDTKQFLDDVLGFDVLAKYIDETKQIQSDIRYKLIQSQADISAIQSQITRMENYEFISGDPVKLKNQLDIYKKDLKTHTEQSNQKLLPLKNELKEKQKKLSEVLTLGKIKKREIDFIKKGKCPTCGAPIDSSHLHVKEQERANLIYQYNELNSHISDLNAHIKEISDELTKYTNEKLSLVKSQENELIKLQEQSKMTSLNQEEIQKLKNKIKKLEKQCTKYNQDLNEYDQLMQIFQLQIKQKVLESFIPTINNKISEISGMLNMKFVPQFDAMFKCSVTFQQNKVPTSSLSTGQLKMVDMVIILAILSSVISKIQSNVIFLDELFSNLDPRTRADLVTVLRATLPANSSILIISHQDMDTDIFDGHIKMNLQSNDLNQNETIIFKIKNNL